MYRSIGEFVRCVEERRVNWVNYETQIMTTDTDKISPSSLIDFLSLFRQSSQKGNDYIGNHFRIPLTGEDKKWRV